MSYNRLIIASAVFGLLAVPASLVGQHQRFYFAGTGGVAVPTGTFNRYVDPGANVGLEVGYSVADRVMFKVEGDFSHLNGNRLGQNNATLTPDIQAWSYTAGIQTDLVGLVRGQTTNRWQLLADLGAGVTRFNSDRYAWSTDTGTPNREFDHTYFGARGGLKLAYAPTRRTSVYVGGKVMGVFADRDDTESLAKINPTSLQSFRTAITVPLTAGLRVRI